jgi:hypothetical protein
MSPDGNLVMEFLRQGLFDVEIVYFCSVSIVYLNVCVVDTRYCHFMYHFCYIVKDGASIVT